MTTISGTKAMFSVFVLLALMAGGAFAADTGLHAPSANANSGWSNPERAYASDNNRASSDLGTQSVQYYNFNIPSIPSGATINGIEVQVEGYTTSSGAARQANITLSWNGGSSYTGVAGLKRTNMPEGGASSEAVRTFGGATDKWGRSWSSGEFNNSKFRLKLQTDYADMGTTLRVDQVRVRVYYSTATCGNGIVETGEQCDSTASCCDSATCQFKPSSAVCGTPANACEIAAYCTGSSETCPANGYQPEGTSCSDGLYCNGAEACNAIGQCVAGTPVSCTANDIPEIGTCFNDPDGNPMTLDTRSAFTSACVDSGADTGYCTAGSEAISHTCSIASCSATCEEGNTQACTDISTGYGGTQSCDSGCAWNACTPTEFCGDGMTNGPEICDGNYRSCTTSGGYSGTEACDSSCSGFGACTSAEFCGDGVQNGIESCDDGASNGQPNHCNIECSGMTPSVCGNGVMETGEACDDGSNNGVYGYCNSLCSGPTADTAAPDVALTYPTDGNYLKGTVALSATASDSESGVARVEFWYASIGTKIGEVSSSPYNYDWDTTIGAEDGTHNIWAVAYDNAGNAAGTTPVTVTVDNTAPTILVNNPGASPATSKTLTAMMNEEGTLYMSVDAGSTCDSSLTFEPYSTHTFTSESDNGKTICYYAVDNAGNGAYQISDPISGIDTTAPTVVMVTSPSSNGAYGIGSGVSVSVQFSEPVTVSPYWWMTCNYWGHCHDHWSYPAINLAVTPGGRYVGYSSGSGTDTLSFSYGVPSGDVSPDLDYSDASALIHNTQSPTSVTITDAAGNAAVLTLPNPGEANSLGYNKDIVIDGLSPEISGSITSGTLGDNGYYVSDVTVSFTCNDAESGIASCTSPQTLSSDGTGQYVTGTAVDNAGNSNTATVSGISIDKTAPAVVSVDSDGRTFNLASMPNQTVKVTFSEDISNTPSIEVHSMSGTPQNVTDCGDSDSKTFCFDYTVPTAEEATHTIVIYGAKDVAGNTMSYDSSHTFGVDTVAPAVAVASFPVVNIANAAAVTLSGSCTNGDGSVSITVSDTDPETSNAYATVACVNGDFGAGWSATFDLSAMRDGALSAEATQNDGAGNSGSATGSSYKDTIAPVITMNGDNPANVMLHSAYTDAGATASDAPDTNLTSNITANNSVNTDLAGTYAVTYDVSDSAANPATQATRAVKVISTMGDASSMNASGLNISVTINGTEAVSGGFYSGVLPVRIYANGSLLSGFDYNFSMAGMDFSGITITAGTGTDGSAYATVDGVNSSALSGTKTLYLHGASGSFNYVCVKDAEGIVSVSQITSGCSASDETKVPCDGSTVSGYACTTEGDNRTVTGLQHSGAMQYYVAPPAPPARTYTGSSYSGGGEVYRPATAATVTPAAPVLPPAPETPAQPEVTPAPAPTPAPTPAPAATQSAAAANGNRNANAPIPSPAEAPAAAPAAAASLFGLEMGSFPWIAFVVGAILVVGILTYYFLFANRRRK